MVKSSDHGRMVLYTCDFLFSSRGYHHHASLVSITGNTLEFESKCFSKKVGVMLICHLCANVQKFRSLTSSTSGISVYYVSLLCGDIALNPGPIICTYTVWEESYTKNLGCSKIAASL